MTHFHMSLTTPDLGATTAFYAALFDVQPDKQHDDYVRFTVSEPPMVLSLMPGPATAMGVDHMGLRLADVQAVRAARERLEARGLVGTLEEGVGCCYALQDKVWLADPDGRAWEVYTVVADTGMSRLNPSACCPTTEPAAVAEAGCCP